jgi:Flp pilus assembly protein TadG
MLARPWSAVRSFFAPILRDRRGAAAVFLAVALVPMIGAVGLAIDSSLGYLLKARMSKSLDAAGLAAGRKALDDDAEAIARAYFDANFGEELGDIELVDFDFELDDEMRHVTLSAEARMPTYFMRVFGHEEMDVSARTVIERQTTGMELALVLDNTGSLWNSDTKTDIAGTPFEAIQIAAGDLIDIIYGEEDELDNVWVSLVPYVAAVNIGTGRSGWLSASDRVRNNPASFRPDLADGGWKGCVMARAYPWDTDDSTPTEHPFTSFFYPATTSDNIWPAINDSYTGTNLARTGPNLGCGTSITPLTKSRTTVEAGIAAMKPWRRGGTTGNLGLVWGWRTLSPKWRGLWGDADLPLDYGTDFMDKVVVIMTDGNNVFYDLPAKKDKNGKYVYPGGDPTTPSDYTAYGRVNAPGPVGLNAATTGDGEDVLNSRMTEICTAMKAEKIKVYTIIFDNGATSSETEALYRSCATSPAMYYYAPSNEALADAFAAIGGQLANLLIIE